MKYDRTVTRPYMDYGLLVFPAGIGSYDVIGTGYHTASNSGPSPCLSWLSHQADFLPKASIHDVTRPRCLSPWLTLKVLRDHIVPVPMSKYVGKPVAMCGMFLVCYDWRKFCCYPVKRKLLLSLSNISRQRGTTAPHLKLLCSDNYIMSTYYIPIIWMQLPKSDK